MALDICLISIFLHMDNILYVTSDKPEQPIISSQVLPLLNAIKDYSITLAMIESNKNKKINYKNLKFFKSIYSLSKYILMNAKNYKIIHFRSYVPFAILWPFLIFSKSKIIFDVRGVMPEEVINQKKTLKSFLIFMYLKISEPILVHFSNFIVVVSRPFKEYLISKYGKRNQEKIKVISTFSNKKKDFNAIDFLEEIKKEKIIISYCGSLTKWQKFDDVLNLYIELQNLFNTTHLLVLTPDISLAKKKLSQKLNKKDFSVLFVKNQELIDYLSYSNLGLLLRDENLINNVSAPIKVKDYLNAEVPILASSKIGDTDYYFKKYNLGFSLESDDFRQELIKNKEIIRNLMNKDKAKFDDFYKRESSLEISIKKYLKLYGALL